jgi:hypothetical protein
VRDHGVAAAEGVLGVPQDVVLGRRLGEPDVAAVAPEVARLEGVGNVLLDDDGAAGGVDEPRAWNEMSVSACNGRGGWSTKKDGGMTYPSSSWR